MSKKKEQDRHHESIKVDFVAEQLHWIALDHAGFANKLPLSSLDQLAQNRQADVHQDIYERWSQTAQIISAKLLKHKAVVPKYKKKIFNHYCFEPKKQIIKKKLGD